MPQRNPATDRSREASHPGRELPEQLAGLQRHPAGTRAGRHLDVAASVFDVLDKKYFAPGRPEDPEAAIQQDGKRFRVKLTAGL